MPFEYKGVTRSYKDWAVLLGYQDGGTTLHYRVKTWGVDKAMEAPMPFHNPKEITFNNKTQSIEDWAEELHYSTTSLQHRIKKHGVEAAFADKKRYRKNERHGMSSTPIYQVWSAMLDRTSPTTKHPQAKDYVGRGIVCCERWRNSFMAFYEDMGDRPHKDSTIERCNNDGMYEKDNCCWSTRVVNQNNMRSNIWMEHNNRRQTIQQWSRELNINQATLYYRVKRGWTHERCLTEPVHRKYNSRKPKAT